MQDHSGKTPLHYAAENNCLQAFEYVTERECRQAIKDLGYDLDDSHENEGNPTTPDGSVDDCSNSSGDDSQIESVKLSDCNTEEDSNCSSSDNLCNDDKNDNEKDDKETVTKLILEEIEGVLRCTVPECDGMIKYEKTIPSKEELWLHGRAKTTETIRRAIQNSKESIAKLSRYYNLNPKTIIKWRKRSFAKDADMGPKHARSTVLTLEEECCIS